jgi:hypothetical protein
MVSDLVFGRMVETISHYRKCVKNTLQGDMVPLNLFLTGFCNSQQDVEHLYLTQRRQDAKF